MAGTISNHNPKAAVIKDAIFSTTSFFMKIPPERIPKQYFLYPKWRGMSIIKSRDKGEAENPDWIVNLDTRDGRRIMVAEGLSVKSRQLRPLLFISALLLIFLGYALGLAPLHRTQQQVRLHYETDWQIEPSFKYDALCFLNVLTGDPFYLKHYGEDYKEFKSLLTKSAKRALSNLEKEIKDKAKSIISAVLCLYFSAVDVVDLDGLLKTLDDYGLMQENLKNSPYYTPTGWQLFLSIREDLRTLFLFLKDI